MAANAIGRALTEEDCKVSINMKSSEVIVSFLRTGGRRVFSIDLANAPTVYEFIDTN
jgi:hypothetical protein